MTAVTKEPGLFDLDRQQSPSIKLVGQALIPPIVTGAIDKANGVLTPEHRKELMDLAKHLRRMADTIDLITKVKGKKSVDEFGAPTFRFDTKVSLPENFVLTVKMSRYAQDAGFTFTDTATMFETFVTFYRKGGKKWQDWTRVWMDWVRREKERIATAPKQRAGSGQLPRW